HLIVDLDRTDCGQAAGISERDGCVVRANAAAQQRPGATAEIPGAALCTTEGPAGAAEALARLSVQILSGSFVLRTRITELAQIDLSVFAFGLGAALIWPFVGVAKGARKDGVRGDVLPRVAIRDRHQQATQQEVGLITFGSGFASVVHRARTRRRIWIGL